MAPDLANILFFADSHAVEVMTFKVILGIPIDHADIRRFEDEIQKVEDVYPSITSPETIQFAIGRELNPPSPLVPLKELKLHLPNGKPEWAGSYGNNTIEVSCHKYEGWEKDWPKAKRRLDMLLGFINPDKTVLSRRLQRHQFLQSQEKRCCFESVQFIQKAQSLHCTTNPGTCRPSVGF